VPKDDLSALLVANVPRDGRFDFGGRLSFTIERRRLVELLNELAEDRLSLKTIINGIKTQQEFATREPSRIAQRLAKTLSQVRFSAAALFAAMSKSCTCRCLGGHTVMMRLDSRVPLQAEKAKVGKRQHKESVEFDLIFVLERSFQPALVHAHHTEGEGFGFQDDPG
jgi:hypothetical protein